MSSTDGKSHTSDETQETPDVVDREVTNVPGSAAEQDEVAEAPSATAAAEAPATEAVTAGAEPVREPVAPAATVEPEPAPAVEPAQVVEPAPAVEWPIILRTTSASENPSEPATPASTMLPPRAPVPTPEVPAAAAVQPEPEPEPDIETDVAPDPGPVETPADAAEQTSPLGVFDDTDTRSRWPKVLLWTGLGVLIAAGAYLGAQWYYADRIPGGTTVAGIDIGGLPAAEATARLTAELGGTATQPVPVTAGGAVGSLDPAAAGLTFDAEATVAGLTEFTLDPRALVAQVAGGDAIDPVTVVDDELLTAATDALAIDLETPATSGTVSFVDGAAVQTAATEGTSVDVEALRETIVDSWLTAARPLELATVPLEPEITQAETDTAFAEAQRVAAAPVSVAVAGQVAEIPVDALTAAASYTPVDGVLVLGFDGSALADAVLARTKSLLSNADDAGFVFVNNVPTIEPGTPGTTLDPATLAASVQAAALGDQRTATVELTASDPAQSTAALEALGIKEIVSEFATPLTNEPDRTENLRIAATKITGTLVLPGETFSLIDTIGPITAANGYLQAHVIVDGEITNGTGGGLSQMSTTTYNAGFFAGMIDVTHTPHSYWFSRYPEGREATLYEGQIDMQWRNDSPYGVLLQSWVGDGKLHVAAWSTKHYTVETTTSGRSNIVAPTTQHKSGPTCAPQSVGGSGFSVSVWRKVTVTGTGESVVDETNTWRYKPQNAVICDG